MEKPDCRLNEMHVVYMKSGLWVYPIFNVLNIPQRIVFFACSYATGFLFYFLGERINYYLWALKTHLVLSFIGLLTNKEWLQKVRRKKDKKEKKHDCNKKNIVLVTLKLMYLHNDIFKNIRNFKRKEMDNVFTQGLI
uniref:Uncharacterized protein n=1 Tax=Rhodnius prolixus TaxID=13249 RepID=T1IBJ2_RHOPR